MLNDNDIVITRQQLEAWATAMKGAIHAGCDVPHRALYFAMTQALEDMIDELTDPDEIDIIDDAALYDPDCMSDGWIGVSEDDDGDFQPEL